MSHHTGELLDGRYRLDDRIARGGMGEVWEGTDVLLNRTVAVKTLNDDRAGDAQFHRRFRHEACAMAALHHPGIADVYDFGKLPGDPYLVMAYVDGQPLHGLIAERGRLPAADTMAIVAQVAHALQAAHDVGIVHRDVKPGNVIIQPDGTAVLVDFGIAHSTRSAALTGTREVVGTAYYIAPERLSKQTAGPAADVYALGAVAYHCLAGHPPFLGEDTLAVAMQHVREEPPPLPGDVPAAARAVVTTALAKDPAARFRSAAAMATAAEQATGAASKDEQTVPLAHSRLRPGSAPPQPNTTVRPRRRVLFVLLLAALALLGASAALALADPFGRDPGSPRPATSAPAAPSGTPSPSESARPVEGGGTGGTPTHSPSRSTGPSPSTTPTRSPGTPTATPTTTAPTSRPTTTPPTGQPTSQPPSSPAPTTGTPTP
jgi:eukaryotic-like serine/threonine-protein kinase